MKSTFKFAALAPIFLANALTAFAQVAEITPGPNGNGTVAVPRSSLPQDGGTSVPLRINVGNISNFSRNKNVAALDRMNEELGKKIPASVQHVFMWDNQHRFYTIHDYVALESTMRMLQSRNTKLLFLERPYVFQNVAEKFQAGTISDKNFKAVMEVLNPARSPDTDDDRLLEVQILADTVIAANKHGMRVHFIDPRVESFHIDHLDTAVKFGHGLSDAFLDYLDKNPDYFEIPSFKERYLAYRAFLSNYMQTRPPQEIQELQKTIRDEQELTDEVELIQARLPGDVKIYDLMDKIAGGANTATLFGGGHIRRRKNDIDANFAAGKTYSISLWDNRELRRVMNESERDNPNVSCLKNAGYDMFDTQIPEATVFLKSAKIEYGLPTFDPIDPDLKPAPGAFF